MSESLVIISIVLLFVFTVSYFFSIVLGFELFTFSKINSLILQTGLRALFRLVGWEVPLILIIGVLSGRASMGIPGT